MIPMQTQTEDTLSLDTVFVTFGDSSSYTSLPLEVAHDGPTVENELLDVVNIDMNSWTAIVQESIVNEVLSEGTIEAAFRDLMERMDQREELDTNNAANPITALLAPGASVSAQLLSSEGPTVISDAVPIIRSEHQSYLCSWRLHESGVKCDHDAPDRLVFLRHLAKTHLVSGNEEVMIICQLLNSRTGLACNAPIKRGNFPRHVDTHYPLRYHCQDCPPGTSFSRKDSWRKHMRSKHA